MAREGRGEGNVTRDAAEQGSPSPLLSFPHEPDEPRSGRGRRVVPSVNSDFIFILILTIMCPLWAAVGVRTAHRTLGGGQQS